MGLTSKYTVSVGRIPEIFNKIRDGQAPDRLSAQHLKDWGFTSSNDRALIPLLKELGFLTPEGVPTDRYKDYRDHSRSKTVMADAMRDAYGDIFLIKEHPSDTDKAAIKGKFKSFHNASDHVASLMTKNFYALLALADLTGNSTERSAVPVPEADVESREQEELNVKSSGAKSGSLSGLHYNIQIHLPASKDVEVYNAIFKSLRAHLLD